MGKEQLSQISRQAAGELIFHILAKGIDIVGRENIPQGVPLIHTFNHSGFLDPFVVGAQAPHLPKVMAKDEVMRIPVIGLVLKLLGSYGVRREEGDISAIFKAVNLLKRGAELSTAIEGTRGRERYGDRQQLKPAKGGVVCIAQLAAKRLGRKVAIVPWAIWGGTEHVWPEIDDREIPLLDRLRQFKREKVFVRICKPISIEYEELDKGKIQEKSDEVMLRIRDQLPPKYHGYYREDLVRYRREVREEIIPKVLENRDVIESLMGREQQTLLGRLEKYYQVYRVIGRRFNIPWYLLWFVHNTKDHLTPDFAEVEKFAHDPIMQPLATVPLDNRWQWKEIAWVGHTLDQNTSRLSELDPQIRDKAFEQVLQGKVEEFRVLQEIFSPPTIRV